MLVVDYCPGGSLHTHVNISLREEGAGFDEARASFYVAEIGLGIAHLHSHGIVHRDLKLENVLMHVLARRADARRVAFEEGSARPFDELDPVDGVAAPRRPRRRGESAEAGVRLL